MEKSIEKTMDRMTILKESSKDVLASIVGSAACVYTGQPFDTVKVRMQVQAGVFSSSIECFKKTMMGEGIATLWRGSVPALIGALSENTVAFTINGNLKRIIELTREDQDVPSNMEPFLSGGITGFCTAFVLCPSDVLKCRAQLSRAQGVSMGFREILAVTWKKQGIKGLYTGIGAQVVRDIPFYASFFGSYDVFCRIMKKNTDWNDTSIYFIAGGLAGQIGWIVSIAPDVVKSTIQTSEAPVGMIETTKQIIASRGIRGLFAGVEVAVVRAFPANAALFVGYELSRKLLPW